MKTIYKFSIFSLLFFTNVIANNDSYKNELIGYEESNSCTKNIYVNSNITQLLDKFSQTVDEDKKSILLVIIELELERFESDLRRMVNHSLQFIDKTNREIEDGTISGDWFVPTYQYQIDQTQKYLKELEIDLQIVQAWKDRYLKKNDE